MSFENCRKQREGGHERVRNWWENQVGIQLQVSKYKQFELDTCNGTPTR